MFIWLAKKKEKYMYKGEYRIVVSEEKVFASREGADNFKKENDDPKNDVWVELTEMLLHE